MPKDNLDRLKKLTGEPDDELLQELLQQAKEAIMGRRFPYHPWPEELEPQYGGLQVQIAHAMYNKLGGDYEISHTENGVSRTWASEGIPQELLARVTPLCKVGR